MTNPVLDALMETTILASVKTKAVGLNHTDKAASDRVNNDHKAVFRASRVVVNRLAGVDSLHKQIISVQNKASALLKSLAQPFGDDSGWWMLPNAKFEIFVRELNPIMQEFNHLKDRVREEGPEMLANAEINKGEFNVRVPTLDELINGYDMKVDFRPIPQSANFRGLDENTVNKLKAMHDARLEAAVHAAERNTLERFVDPLERFVDRMKAYDEKLVRDANDPDAKKRDGIFRDTVVTNIKDLWENLSAWNITGDPRFTELGNQLASIANIDPKQLRENDAVRSAATNRAQEVADNLKGWLT